MPFHQAFGPSDTNYLLASLPKEEFERLRPGLERVHLLQGKVLYESGDIVRHSYFPTCGMISLLSTTKSGQTIEIGMVGNEGMLGVPLILKVDIMPYRSTVQISGDAMRIRAETLKRAFEVSNKLRDILLRYTHSLLTQVSQSAVCNSFHTTEKRLCRWLLIAHDRVQLDTLPLTQELISHMLGCPRTGVTMAACALQEAGLIRYRRGKITILNRRRLEAAACECYEIAKSGIKMFPAA